MKKLLYILLIGILLVGCQNAQSVENTNKLSNDKEEINVLPIDANAVESQVAFDVVGEIIQMEGNQYHVLSGDIVEIYTVSSEVVNAFFVGDTVGLVLNGDHYEVYLYDVAETIQRFTTMGDPINVTTGVITEISEASFVILSRNMELTFDVPEAIMAEVGDVVTVDYMESLEGRIFLALYNENRKLEVEVLATETNDSGVILVHLGTDGEIGYIADMTHTLVNFELRELRVGDTVDVYFGSSDDLNPAHIKPDKMIKTN